MIYEMTLKDSTDEMTFNLLEVPIVDKDIEGAVDNVTLDGNQYTDYLYLKKQYIQKWSIMCDEEYERLRGFYTRQFDEAEIPTYELYYGETIYNDYTLSGEYIYADVHGVEPARMSLAQLNGNATQTTYSGKNLWNGAEPLAVTGYDTYALAKPLPAGTYTLSASSITTTGTGAYSLVMFLDSANQTVASDSVVYSTKQKSLTLPSEATQVRIYSQGGYQQSQGVTTTFTGIQIESGSTATSYEPYVGGTASPNPSYPQHISVVTGENVVKVVGKNLLPTIVGSATRSGVTISADNGTVTASGSATADMTFTLTGNEIKYDRQYSQAIPVTSDNSVLLDAGTYYFSGNIQSNNVSLIMRLVEDGAALSSGTAVTANSTFTIATQKRFCIAVYADNGKTPTLSLSNLQLELGSAATDYEPYQGQEFPIDLGSLELAKIGTYQDRIYKDDEKWYVEKQVGKVVLDGSESWGVFTQNSAGLWAGSTPLAVDVVQGANVALANYFTYKWSFNSNTPCFYVYNQSGHGNVEIIQADYSTLDTFKTWLSTHPTTIYYALATPTVTEITEQALIDQLEALTNVSITTGIHNIFTEVASGNLNPVMIFDFIEVVSKRVTLVPETPVRLTLTDGGIINACGCRKDVQLTMRETIE